MTNAAHKDTDSEQYVDIQFNNKDIKLELQVYRTHINGGYLLLAAVKPGGIRYIKTNE